MSRIKIERPEQFHFSCLIPVRITDINYGGHVGNDTVLSIIHEARMQFFKYFGYTEMQFAGTGMIMTDAAIEFRNELFYGDMVIASVMAREFTKVGFELLYKLEKETLRQDESAKMVQVVVATTRMVCYNYEKKKIVSVPDEAKVKLTS